MVPFLRSTPIETSATTIINNNSNNMVFGWMCYQRRNANESVDFTEASASDADALFGSNSISDDSLSFQRSDQVLCVVTYLDLTSYLSPDLFTMAPVNIHGYPRGAGSSGGERSGPHRYVLATVTQVHRDGDGRCCSYTVKRADTGTEQRAAREWLEPLGNPEGIEAATLAAAITTRSKKEERPKTPARRRSLLTWAGR
ncbi:expressed unknown protein [Seminavis robusta]|uniref:Uncharacterized protein n=1 Tax=Seminavis robusta TaxID=568900 RepID=A0A9N8DFZ4_9STRA|nr:expressed unknown protein [Seminavis robusta]|eukprot:Sro74_g040820.1 n/a (199) ;mRNA; f:82575-83285